MAQQPFGRSLTQAAPDGVDLRADDALGANVAGVDQHITAGNGTGTGTPGKVKIRTPTTIGAGSTLQTPTERVSVDESFMEVFVGRTAKTLTTTIGANTNNLAVADAGEILNLSNSTGGSLNLTGIVAPAPGVPRILAITNVTAAQNIVITDEDALSTNVNRISAPNAADITLTPKSSVILVYRVLAAGLSRWSVLAKAL